MNNIFFIEKITEINPFSSDGKYDDKWVELSITNTKEYMAMTGKTHIFGFKISKTDKNWTFRAMDYINYNTMLERNIIFTGKKSDYSVAKQAYTGHSVNDMFLRPYEPKISVHSTTLAGYNSIIKDGAIKSWNRVKAENNREEDVPIGALLSDPADFSDYVMLSSFGYWNEIVVNSKQKGYICMDADCEYTPGARFYFDTKQLICDGLFVRDGAHNKVKDKLPLDYALFIATLNNVSIDGKITPKTFAQAADETFEGRGAC